MAHTYGGGGRLPASGTTVASNPTTVSLNLPAGTTVLWVSIVAGGTTARAGGAPTFNSVALTAGNAKANAGGTPETCQEDWYMLAPPTGSAYTLSIPNGGTLAMAITYAYASASAGNTSVYDNKVSTGGSSTNPSTSFTVADGAIWFGGVGSGAQSWNSTATSGTQINEWDAGSWGRDSQYGVKSGTGSQTVSWTFGTSEDWIIQAISFKEQAVPVTGSMAATETGSDTLAAAGDVLVQGALAASETGSDTFTASGGVLVQGAMAATESGADTFAASGTVADPGATGTMVATESGADQFAGFGMLGRIGIMAAVESGSDRFRARSPMTQQPHATRGGWRQGTATRPRRAGTV
jgi:hypothetical protein